MSETSNSADDMVHDALVPLVAEDLRSELGLSLSGLELERLALYVLRERQRKYREGYREGHRDGKGGT